MRSWGPSVSSLFINILHFLHDASVRPESEGAPRGAPAGAAGGASLEAPGGAPGAAPGEAPGRAPGFAGSSPAGAPNVKSVELSSKNAARQSSLAERHQPCP